VKYPVTSIWLTELSRNLELNENGQKQKEEDERRDLVDITISSTVICLSDV
jgi:hypothetical protein